MTSRELIKKLVKGEPVPRCGFWMGNPHHDTWPLYLKYFKAESHDDIRRILKDDIAWLPADGAYKAPDGLPTFKNPRKGNGLSSGGVFSDCNELGVVESYPWPDVRNFDFSDVIEQYRNAGDLYRAGGMWSPFFHVAADMFGMENYFIKMYTHPEIVKAVTGHIVDFYLAGTRKLFEESGDEVDAFFFGNDFGTQLDLLINPDAFEEFVFPYFKKLVDLGHEFDKHVILHSCGSIYKVVPRLIDLGVDVLHPLQAKAANMDADTLVQFKGRLTFMGGVDTQDLLVNGSPQDIRNEVCRIRSILGPQLIVSPSHEALLSNVPPENILAMSEGVYE